VLGNLVGNALKFTPPGGTIRVRGWGADSGLFIEVADSGQGMPADQLPHVFDKYYQIGEQARSKGAGSASPSPMTWWRNTAAPSP
jgi:signal transduction histidine kinase